MSDFLAFGAVSRHRWSLARFVTLLGSQNGNILTLIPSYCWKTSNNRKFPSKTVGYFDIQCV